MHEGVSTKQSSVAAMASNNAKNKAEDWKEPKITWAKSKARNLLYNDLVSGVIPLGSKDETGRKTIPSLREIYAMHPEYALYHYSKFSSRVSSLRSIVKEGKSRAEADQRLFEAFVDNHPASAFSRNGYIQWQGSEAQTLARQDIAENLHKAPMGKKGLYNMRPEYYKNFPLKVFHDKLNQEIKTAKYLYTLKEKGKHHKAS